MPPRRKTKAKRKAPAIKKKKARSSVRASRARRGSRTGVSAHQRLLRQLRLAALKRVNKDRRERAPQLLRHERNPIIEPRENNFWEMKATFNPGAIYADDRVHLLYRAIGGDDISVLGYASSADGSAIDERLESPAFVPPRHKKEEPADPAELAKIAYCSGGGWNGGCEDPRLTLIGERVYLIYTAFDGWSSLRMALTSIGLDDFLEQRWDWKKPSLISPPGEIHKNWVLFPEKIGGRFALLHSISPVIEVAYFDDIAELEEGKSRIDSHYNRFSRTGSWDSSVRGAGPPPIKTELGWLLLYHAMDVRDPDRYKVGAMILDLDDPTKVLYRTKGPILEPDAHYENNGFKAGVVYACGAVVKDGELYVYYGGSDSVTCVAMANLKKFLEEIKRSGTPQLAPPQNPRVRRPVR